MDEICPELVKVLDVVGLFWLIHLWNIAPSSWTVPLEWQTGVMVPLFKKGNERVCYNYQGITDVSLPRQVCSRILERRIRVVG